LAIESNVPLTFINHSNGSHGFDTNSSRQILAQSQEIIAFTLDYLTFHLMAE
jgi:hypothetical protein